MSEHDISLVTSQAGSVISENLKTTLGTQAAGFSPSQVLAMVGINQNTALKLPDSVVTAKNNLAAVAADPFNPNQAAASAALASLNAMHDSLGFGSTPNQAAFGSFLQQAVGHCNDSVQINQNMDFLSKTNFSNFGSGITNLGSMADRGVSNSFGSFAGTGELIKSTGSMFNGVDVKDFGTTTGLVKSLQDNKLANFTSINQKLTNAGVPLDDLDNPVYKEKIDQVCEQTTDPITLGTVADQYQVAPEVVKNLEEYDSQALETLNKMREIIKGVSSFTNYVLSLIPGFNSITTNPELDAYRDALKNGDRYTEYKRLVSEANRITIEEIRPRPDDKVKLSLVLYRNEDVEAALNSVQLAVSQYNSEGKKARARINSTTAQTSTQDSITTVPSGTLESVTAPTGRIKNLKDLCTPEKLAEPGAAEGGATTDEFRQKWSDMGASTVTDAGAAGDFWGQFKTGPATPQSDALSSSLGLKGIMDSVAGQVAAMTGSGTGLGGMPNAQDFMQHVSGGPAIDALNSSSLDATAIASFAGSMTAASSLFNKAGIDLTSPVPNTLGSCMAMASNLKKWGQDALTGVGGVIGNMVNTANAYGEGVKASLVEGFNDKLLSKNGIPPLKFNGSEYPPTTSGKNENDFWSRFTS